MRRLLAVFTTILIATIMGGGMAWATPPGNETKTGLCHRTASDSNPYVFIEVDDNSLQSHLTDTKGHFPKKWKSDGVFRSVAHVKGDLKHDYEATSADECLDNTPAKPDPVVEQTTDERMSCEAGVEEQTTTVTTEYVGGDGEWVLGEPVTDVSKWTFVRDLTKSEQDELGCNNEPPKQEVTATRPGFTDPTCDLDATVILPDDGLIYTVDGKVAPEKTVTVTANLPTGAGKFVLVGKTSWTHTFGPAASNCETKNPPKDEPSNPTKKSAPPEPTLPHTGANLWLALIGSIAVGLGGMLMRLARQ